MTNPQDGSASAKEQWKYGIEILEPADGGTVSATPFRVVMRTTGGFRVPEDGEVQMTMTYEGRGREVRVLQVQPPPSSV